MKYPINTAMLTEARMYARESIENTADYEGWKDQHRKMERIVSGTFVQLWLCEYCRLNDIPHKADRSSPYVADSWDLKIAGFNIDCKSSYIDGLEGQITKHHDDKNNIINAYCFFRTDRTLSYVEPLGVISKRKVHDNSLIVKEGDIIPGTKFTQRFGYSYFVNIASLTNLDDALDYFVRNSRITDGKQNAN